MMHSRSTDSTSRETVVALIEEINRDYRLRIPLEAVCTSFRAVSADEVLAREASRRINSKHDPDLPQKLRTFRQRVIHLQRKWVAKPQADFDLTPEPSAPLPARGVEERSELLNQLLEALDGHRVEAPAMPKKRQKKCAFNEDEQPARRAKQVNKYPGQPHPYLVDALPVRTVLNAERKESTMARLQKRAQIADLDLPVALDTSGRDTLTERSSGEKPPKDRNTLFQYFDNQPKTRKLIFGATTSAVTGGSSESSPDLVFCDFPDSDLEIDEDLNNASLESVSDESSTSAMERRLQGVWPGCNPRASQRTSVGVPFAIWWEVQRIADHCGIDLGKAELDLGIEDEWRDQTLFRDRLKTNTLFAGNHFPSRNDDIVWRTALNSGQRQHKAVSYAAEWVYRKEQHGPLYRMKLRPLTLQPSHRMNRRFGADRWLEIRMPSISSESPPSTSCSADEARHQIVNWLTSRNHQFLGRTWSAVYIEHETKKQKTNTAQGKVIKQHFCYRVRLFATHGDEFRAFETSRGLPPEAAALSQTDRYNVSQTQLLQWAIGLNTHSNVRQPAVKLFSRLKLSFSQAQPTVVLQKHQIRHVEKTIGKGMDMADGAGQMSWALARLVAKHLGLDDVPCAFQARIGGCKGMWVIDLHSVATEEIWLETWPSQRKFECPYEEESHRCFEVRRWPTTLQTANLNSQLIVILEQNAIDKRAMRTCIGDRLTESLRVRLLSLRDAIDEPADLRAWVRRIGNLSDRRASHAQVRYLAGAPDSTEEKIEAMLDSGFDLQQRYLCELVTRLATQKAEEVKEQLKISTPHAAFAYILPDFWGFLEEGEIAFSTSNQFRMSDGRCDNLLEGDVLVARLPAHTTGDIQKVRAVLVPELRRFKDVIFFSTKGNVPLADKLSGGDYDGDEAIIIWDQEIVDLFHNNDFPPQPDLGLKHDKTTFAQILSQESRKRGSPGRGRRIGTDLDRAARKFVELAFDFNTRKTLLGAATKYKESYAYHYSLRAPKAMQLSHLLSQLVDAAKQGTLFYQDDWDQFRRDRNLPILDKPAYESTEAKRQRDFPTRHILDWLHLSMCEQLECFQSDFAGLLETKTCLLDDGDLTRPLVPWSQAAKVHKYARTFLSQLRDDIRLVADDWWMTHDTQDFSGVVRGLYERWLAIRPSKEFEQYFPSTFLRGPNAHQCDDFALLKAAVTFDSFAKQSTSFAFHMASRQLCFLKALARGEPDSAPVLVVPPMYAILRPDMRLIERLAVLRRAHEDEESGSEYGDDEM